jgi:hypothetical protein
VSNAHAAVTANTIPEFPRGRDDLAAQAVAYFSGYCCRITDSIRIFQFPPSRVSTAVGRAVLIFACGVVLAQNESRISSRGPYLNFELEPSRDRSGMK